MWINGASSLFQGEERGVRIGVEIARSMVGEQSATLKAAVLDAQPTDANTDATRNMARAQGCWQRCARLS